MRELRTGDLVFTRSPLIVPRLIRLFSAFVPTVMGEYVPSHVGMIRVMLGEPYVQEALWGRGFVKTPWDEWYAAHGGEAVRVLHMPFTGLRTDLGRVLEEMEGTPYAKLRELVRSVGDRNRDNTSRDFCSAACQRVIERAMHARIRELESPDNTNPYELYTWAHRIGKEEKL